MNSKSLNTNHKALCDLSGPTIGDYKGCTWQGLLRETVICAQGFGAHQYIAVVEEFQKTLNLPSAPKVAKLLHVICIPKTHSIGHWWPPFFSL